MRQGFVRFYPWFVCCLAACQCDNLGVERIPGNVKATLCNPVSGQPSADQELVVESGSDSFTARSGGDGQAEIASVPAGELTVRIRHDVNGQHEASFDHVHKAALEEGGTHAFVDPSCIVFPLDPGKGGVQGQICNRHTGSLLGGAEVSVRSNAGDEWKTTTDNAGFFVLNAVSPGDHALTVRGEGFQKTYPVHVESGQVTHLDLGQHCTPFDPSSTGNIDGKLCANNGEGSWALARASVTLPDNSVREDVSDAAGHFLIEGVPAGEYDVHVEGSGESQTLHAVVTAGQTTALNPESECPVPNPDETGDVRGQLCDPMEGGWLIGATARAEQAGRNFQDNTDERGRFHLAGLAPGTVVVEVTKGPYARQFEVPITAGATVTVADGVCAPPTGECKTQDLHLEDAEPLRIMLVVDKSGSMVESFDTSGTKWSGAVQALKSVTSTLQEDAAFGMALFPSGADSFTQCAPGNVVVSPAPNNAQAIGSALDTNSPGGGTPTAGALTVVRHWFETNGSETAPLVILATDGVPNCNDMLNPNACTCPPDGCNDLAELCLDDDGALSAISALTNMGIRTYVIGLPGSSDPTDVLTRMATAGGTNAGNGHAYYAPSNAEELVGDMTEIVQTNRTCRFELDAAPNDPAAVEVNLDTSVIPRDQARRNGWDLVGEKGIELFGSTCTTIRTGVNHTLAVRYCVDS